MAFARKEIHQKVSFIDRGMKNELEVARCQLSQLTGKMVRKNRLDGISSCALYVHLSVYLFGY